MEIAEEKMEVNSRFFKVNYFQLENAVVAFFFEERMRLGTVAIAMPGNGEVAAGRSSVLVGGKYIMITRAMAEKLAAKAGKVAMVSLFTELDETEALRTYTRLLDKVPITPQSDAKPTANHSIRENI